MKRNRTGSKVALMVGAAALIFLALTLFGNAGQVQKAFAAFDWRYLPWVLLLSLGNYAVRFLRWHYYLRKLRVSVPTPRSLAVFMGGLTMSVTPAKLGEFLKSYLLWERERIPVGLTAPVVLAERVTDSVAIILLCATGIGVFRYAWELWGGMFAIMALLGALVVFRKSLINWFSRRFALASQPAEAGRPTNHLQRAVSEVLRPAMTALGTLLGTLAWFLECVGLFLVVLGFDGGSPVSLVQATFIYAFATFAGAVALIPGGLGVAEASITGLLLTVGIRLPIAVSTTILVRLSTLWFAVALGAIFLLAMRKPPPKPPLAPLTTPDSERP